MVSVWGLLSSSVDRPLMLLIIIPVALLVAFLVYLRFGKQDREEWRHQKKIRSYVFVSRLIIFALLLIALSSPYSIYEKLAQSEPAVVFMMDNSSSFDLFDRSKGYELDEQLEQQLEIDLRLSGDSLDSPLGDDLLASLRKGGSVLVMSDGQINKGASLGEVVEAIRKSE